MVSTQTYEFLSRYWSFNSRIHGARHWAHVACLGRKLAEQNDLDGASLRCINAFGWTHDLWRTHDGSGNEHAQDGGIHFLNLDCDLIQQLSEAEQQLVARAIRYHSDGYIACEAYDLGLFDGIDLPEQWVIDTVGCCWDADRLDLNRLGSEPKAELMSTEYWLCLVKASKNLNSNLKENQIL